MWKEAAMFYLRCRFGIFLCETKISNLIHDSRCRIDIRSQSAEQEFFKPRTINVVIRSERPKLRLFRWKAEIILKVILWLREMYKSLWVIGKHTLHGKGRRNVLVRTQHLGCFAVWCLKRINKEHRLSRVGSATLTVVLWDCFERRRTKDEICLFLVQVTTQAMQV